MSSDANYQQIYYTKVDERSLVNINYILPDNSTRYLVKVKTTPRNSWLRYL